MSLPSTSTKPKKLVKRRPSDSMKRSRKSYEDGETSTSRLVLPKDEAEEEDGFAALGLTGVDLMNLDPRPAFVVTLDTDFSGDFEPLFSNSSLLSNQQLYLAVTQPLSSNSPTFSRKVSILDFRAWLKEICLPPEHFSDLSSILFHGYTWTAFVVRQQWIVISGTVVATRHSESQSDSRTSCTLRDERISSPISAGQSLTDTQRPKPNLVIPSKAPVTPSTSYNPPATDWTISSPDGYLSSHLIFARSIDWAATPLGDMTQWTREFRQVANLLMRNPHPAALFWGEELTVMYNKPYADTIAGHKHPELMGTGFRGPFAELWETVGEIFDECLKDGKSVAMNEQMLPISRRGFLEETFFTWSLTPLYGGTKQLLGFYNAPFETTRQTVNDRRIRTLLKMGEEVALAKSVSDFWARVLNALKENEFDFPFALLYAVVDEADTDEEGSTTSSDTGSSHIMKTCLLEGSLGVPDNHPSAPLKLDLKRSKGGFVPAFRNALKTREPKLINIMDGSLSESLLHGIQWRGFGEACKTAIVCPM